MSEIRVLLVVDGLEDARFLRDALSELEETTHGGSWFQFHVDHLEFARDAVLVLESAQAELEGERPDIVLFDPGLPDSRGLGTLLMLRDAAPGVPLIALLDSGDEGLGRRMLRYGAQDFLLKSEIDCGPLGRAVLNAIERQRLHRQCERFSGVDAETGFYRTDVFSSIAARDLQHQCGRPLTLILAEVDNLAEVDESSGREASRELILEAANVIRAAAGPAALLGRWTAERFAILTWEDRPEAFIFRILNELQAGRHVFAFVFGHASTNAGTPATLDVLMQSADSVLYENKQACLNLP